MQTSVRFQDSVHAPSCSPFSRYNRHLTYPQEIAQLLIAMPLFNDAWELGKDNDETICGPGAVRVTTLEAVKETIERVNEFLKPKKRQQYYAVFMGFFGNDISRAGKLLQLTITTLEGHTWVFDVPKLEKFKESFWDFGLNEFLSDPHREKVMFDCKHIADLLMFQQKIELRGVCDLKVMEAMERGKLKVYKPLPISGEEKVSRERFLCMEELVQYYTNDKEMKRVLGGERPVWDNASELCLEWTLLYQKFLVTIWAKFHHANARHSHRDVLWWVSSEIYCTLLSHKESRTYDHYETSDIIPSNVLCHRNTDQPLGIVRCTKCSRYLPTKEFAKNMLCRQKVAVCVVCIKIGATPPKMKKPAKATVPIKEGWKNKHTMKASVLQGVPVEDIGPDEPENPVMYNIFMGMKKRAR